MKIRPSKAYLVISSAHLGMSPNILKVFGNVAKYYNATAVHLGTLITEAERKEYRGKVSKVRTWQEDNESQSDNLIYKYDKSIQTIQKEIDLLLEDRKSFPLKKRYKFTNKIDKLKIKIKQLTQQREDKLKTLDEKLEHETNIMSNLEKIQDGRIQKLKEHFPQLKFVINSECVFPSFFRIEGIDYEQYEWHISRHLHLGSIGANGEKVSSTPITTRALNFLRQKRKSWILPHPIPAAESFPREGLNQAFNYLTPGSLKDTEDPRKPNEFYRCTHEAAAVMVLIDDENEEFHARHLYIDYCRNDDSHRLSPMVTDDGLLFDVNGVKKIPSRDKAVFIVDSHAPYTHPGVVAATRSLNALHQPATFISGGDESDFRSVCRHTKNVPAERENLRLKDDLEGMRELLNSYINVDCINTKIVLDSNHNEWLTQFVQENPALIGLCDWPNLAATTFKDWTVYLRDGNDHTFWFGSLAIRHGDQEKGANNGAAIFGNYLCGHWHRYRSYRRGMSVGPSCRLGLRYLGGTVTAWQSQVTVITKFKEQTSKSPKTVLHDEGRKISRFSYQNKIYEVDFYEK